MATRYAVGADSNNTNSWSTSSGGASGASVPTSADDAIWDNNSIDMTLTADLSCLSATFTDYTATLTRTNKLLIYGNLTLGANMTLAGAGRLEIAAACTITSNGKSWANEVYINNINAVTLGDNMTIGNLIGVGTPFFNNNTLKINGNIDASQLRGTSVYSFEGTGYINTGGTFGFYNSDLVINTAGAVELRDIYMRAGSITITAAGSLDISSNINTMYQTATFNLGGYKLGTLTTNLNSNNTYTINGSVAKFTKILANFLNATHSYVGTHGWEADEFIQAKLVTLKAGFTYTVNNLIENNNAKLQSSVATSDAYLNTNNAFQAFTGAQEIVDINSSGGDRLYTYGATLTRTTNWQNITSNQVDKPLASEVKTGVVYDHANETGTMVAGGNFMGVMQ